MHDPSRQEGAAPAHYAQEAPLSYGPVHALLGDAAVHCDEVYPVPGVPLYGVEYVVLSHADYGPVLVLCLYRDLVYGHGPKWKVDFPEDPPPDRVYVSAGAQIHQGVGSGFECSP